MFWLKFINKFIKVLRAGESPELIAGGFTFGFFLGVTPFGTLQSMLVLLLALLTKVNLAAVFFGTFLFSFVAYLFDPQFHDLGYFLLVDAGSLKSLWTSLYNMPVVPFTRFNNTVVLGSTVTALALAVPVYLLTKRSIVAYRTRWAEKVENARWVKAFKASFVFKWYVRVRDLEF